MTYPAARVQVSVVVVTYNSRRDLPGLLASLQDAAPGVDLDVVVVDNGSTDGTREWVAALTDVRLVCSANVGFGAGVNAGVSAGRGVGPILVLNPDTRLAPGSVGAMLEVSHRRGAAVVLPRLVDPDGTLARSLRREPTVLRTTGRGNSRWPLLSEVVNEDAAYATEGVVDWGTGAAMLVDRTMFEALGGFDEWFFMYSEETDLCLRARDAGGSCVFTPDAEVVHVGGASGRTPDLYAMQVLNRVRLHRRRHSAPATAALVLLTLAREWIFARRGREESAAAVRALRGRRPALLPWTHGLLVRSRPAKLSAGKLIKTDKSV